MKASNEFKVQAFLKELDGFQGVFAIQPPDGESGVDNDEIADGRRGVNDIEADLFGDAADFYISDFVMSEASLVW